VAKTTRKNCSCFAGSSTRVVFRIDYRFWKIFFNGSRKYQVLKRLEGSYRVHLWKKKSSQEDITVDQTSVRTAGTEILCTGNSDLYSDIYMSVCVVIDTALLKYRVL